ncbi:hypothetical protein DFA_02594 [Cavenderia fasciculata]|uniref:Trypsin-like serine protease n=1 Tax=Cavenderia fasciculata TaxID=261658 RepID=F4PZU1_CACFS|nr:uncharacterized protein DFA_02594 [Cavenderia fasciculata]EGG18855.1 hypothetical protein DFA_02594 [Cavenderia fasciculata]|eukprot:XP_004357317.1 hypothetical protein DFA_02594 [Cavenderia fasciculata]
MTTQKCAYGYGTGILIGKKYVITVKHVAMPADFIKNQNSIPVFQDKTPVSYYIGLNHPTTRWAMARLLGLSNDHDLALLEIIDNDVPDLSILSTPLLGEVCETQDVLTRSFPRNILSVSGTYLMNPGLPTIPTPIQCTKRGYISCCDSGRGILQIDLSAEKGYSGTGVITTTGKPCGVIFGGSDSNIMDALCESYNKFIPFVNNTLKQSIPPLEQIWPEL